MACTKGCHQYLILHGTHRVLPEVHPRIIKDSLSYDFLTKEESKFCMVCKVSEELSKSKKTFNHGPDIEGGGAL